MVDPRAVSPTVATLPPLALLLSPASQFSASFSFPLSAYSSLSLYLTAFTSFNLLCIVYLLLFFFFFPSFTTAYSHFRSLVVVDSSLFLYTTFLLYQSTSTCNLSFSLFLIIDSFVFIALSLSVSLFSAYPSFCSLYHFLLPYANTDLPSPPSQPLSCPGFPRSS